jgi:hypothetical protein
MRNLLILVCLALASCQIEHEKQASDPHKLELDNDSRYYDQNYKVYTLEGCEYVVVGHGRSQWGSHKGNCKNPIHKTQK